ncbi:hypothetical protein [Absidia glauca]|uniref:Uncharacterized protein n=1 Tax=Absidia glauca TaxID=4829 RepID=A0A168QSM8_ABSGL|nr:hypothetical protein [Absidia glauca]
MEKRTLDYLILQEPTETIMNSDTSPTERQASEHAKKNKFVLHRVFGGLKGFIDKGKTDAVKTEPPPITRYRAD